MHGWIRAMAFAACFLTALAVGPPPSADPLPVRAEEGRAKLVFTTFPSSGMEVLFRRILTEAYGRIGLDVKILSVPAERALAMSNQGLSDGEAARVAVIEDTYTNLVRVPTPLYTNVVVGFSKITGLDPAKGWSILDPYRIGSVLGYKYIEKQTQDHGAHTLATCYHQLFAMLKNDRLDVALTEYLDVMPSLVGFHFGEIRLLSPPFARNPMYHYLHKKHADLVPRIDAVLARMKEEGRLDAILRETVVGFEVMQRGGGMPRCNVF